MKKIDVKSLHKGMQSHGYICSPLLITQVASGLNSRPTRGIMLHGPAGVGKSFLPEVISKVLDVKMFWHQVSPGTYETDLLLKLYPSEDTKSGMTIEESTIYQAAIASQKERVLLVLDEWDKSRPSADGFFLDFFQSGRLPLPPQNGKKIVANLDNLMIMLTSNDERPFSEPFLRRFSKIDMEQLHPKLVKDALLSTHPNHPYLPNALILYCRALASQMDKPVTIQELRNLLDAIEYLGKYADWDTLVRQYITKTEENHLMLKDAESIDLDDFDWLDKKKIKIESSNYGSVPENIQGEEIAPLVVLPTLIESVDWTKRTGEGFVLEDVESKGGIVENCDEMYSMFAYLGTPTDNPFNLTWIKECTDTLALNVPVEIENLLIRHDGRDSDYGALGLVYPLVGKSVGRRNGNRTKSYEDLVGEIMLTLGSCERGEFLRMSKYNRHIIKSITSDEVISRRKFDENVKGVKRTIEINFRWTERNGMEVICPISYVHQLNREFSTGSSGQARLFRTNIESNDDCCPSNTVFVRKNRMPHANIKALRQYERVAEFGVTRYGISSAPHKSNDWTYIMEAVNKAPGGEVYSTADVNPSEHQFFDTDWVSCKSITVGSYITNSGYYYIELRIHGNMSSGLIYDLLSTRSIESIPLYVFVDGTNARTILNELSKQKSWVPYPYVRSSICNDSNKIKFSAFGNVGCFWTELYKDTADKKMTVCNQLRTLRDKYSK